MESIFSNKNFFEDKVKEVAECLIHTEKFFKENARDLFKCMRHAPGYLKEFKRCQMCCCPTDDDQVSNHNSQVMDNLSPGDAIMILTHIYAHWALYLGNGIFSHLDVPKKCFLTTDAEVKEETIDIIVKNCYGRKSYIVKYESDSYPRIGRADVKATAINRARRMKGQEWKYHLFNNNCEHYVKWCLYGEKKSEQIAFIKNKLDSKEYLELTSSNSALKLCANKRIMEAFTEYKEHVCKKYVDCCGSRPEGFSNINEQVDIGTLKIVALIILLFWIVPFISKIFY